MNWRALNTSQGKIGIVIALLWPLVKFIIWLVERAGDLDFIVEKKDSILGVLANPLFPLGFTIVGIAIVAWGAKRREATVDDLHDAPQGMPGEISPEPTPSIGVQLQRTSYDVFHRELERCDEVWAFWHTGGSAGIYDLFGNGEIRQLILADLMNEELGHLGTVTNITVDGLREQIGTATRQAQDSGCLVKWWKGHLSNSITIGNPNRLHAWCKIEAFLPLRGAHERPSIQISKSAYPEEYGHYESLFLQIWNH